MSATLTPAGLIPEAKCAHAELRGSMLARATCPDCGAFVDLGSLPTYSVAEYDAAIEKAEDRAYEDAEAAQDKLSALEGSVGEELDAWVERINAAMDTIADADDDRLDGLFSTMEDITGEMGAWRA